MPGECVEYCLGPIPSNMVGVTIYFQGIVWNMTNLVVPIPTTNVCATTYR